jgi:hypothetical protein
VRLRQSQASKSNILLSGRRTAIHLLIRCFCSNTTSLLESLWNATKSTGMWAIYLCVNIPTTNWFTNKRKCNILCFKTPQGINSVIFWQNCPAEAPYWETKFGASDEKQNFALYLKSCLLVVRQSKIII